MLSCESVKLMTIIEAKMGQTEEGKKPQLFIKLFALSGLSSNYNLYRLQSCWRFFWLRVTLKYVYRPFKLNLSFILCSSFGISGVCNSLWEIQKLELCQYKFQDSKELNYISFQYILNSLPIQKLTFFLKLKVHCIFTDLARIFINLRKNSRFQLNFLYYNKNKNKSTQYQGTKKLNNNRKKWIKKETQQKKNKSFQNISVL